jgi:UDPglucose 6-dehydrogenase
MKIGFLGLGKLGLPCAMAIEAAGHEVIGYDVSEAVREIVKTRKLPYREEGAQALLDKTNLKLVDHPRELIDICDLIFVAVQTPHHSKYEGVTRLPTKRVDFDYTHLKEALLLLSHGLETNQWSNRLHMGDDHKTEAKVVVISTVLPGTMEREIMPLLNSGIKLCYNPFFIAMGTTIYDFTHPEFVLFGVDDPGTAQLAEEFYKTIHDRPFYKTTVKNAELIKVAYNTFISTKLAFVNTLMEVCHKTGCDVDAVTDGLKLANERLISTRYMTAGMGDGGGCHPRDNIALSWLARKLELGFDFFEAIMLSRERQTDWFADLIEEESSKFERKNGYKPFVYIMGSAFKPETNLISGSPARLLESILRERGIETLIIDPIVNPWKPDTMGGAGVYFIGCKHQVFATTKFPEGSTVIDPNRYILDQPGVTVVRIGEGK